MDWPCESGELTTDMKIQITTIRMSVFLSSQVRRCFFHRHHLFATVGRSTHLAVHVFAKKRLVASAAHEFL
jgi:hypothetical protein